jgi:hypothetical protein
MGEVRIKVCNAHSAGMVQQESGAEAPLCSFKNE